MVHINRMEIDVIDQHCRRPMGVPLPPFIFKLSRDHDGRMQLEDAFIVGNLMRNLAMTRTTLNRPEYKLTAASESLE